MAIIEESNAKQTGGKREYHVGTQGSAEFWLVPYGGNRSHKKFEIRKSKRELPESLQGMFLTVADGEKAYNAYDTEVKLSKKTVKNKD
jgi:hypothetical protein